MRRLLAAFLLVVAAAGSILVSSGKAEASSGRASRPWRSIAAPAVVALALSDYVMQPPNLPNPGEGGQEDTTDFEPKLPEPGTQPPAGNPQNPFQSKFSKPDTAARHDSLFSVPGAAPVETIGPSSMILPAPSAPPSRPPGVRTRRGIFGVHPLAILVGLIAFHIFIVTVAGK